MKKGLKFSLGAVLAAAAFATCPTVQAAELGDTVTTFEPAVALVMPFDVTDGPCELRAGEPHRRRGLGSHRDPLVVLVRELRPPRGRVHLS